MTPDLAERFSRMPFDLGSSLLDSLPDAVIALGTDGCVLWWNRTAETVFGHACNEAVGQSIFELIVPADGREQERQWIAAAAAGADVMGESVRRRRDGELLHASVCTRAVRGPDGLVEYLLSSQKDVTELKVARNARLLQSRFGDLVESTPDAIVIADLSARIVLVNGHAERLFGYRREELVGHSVEALVPLRHRSGELSTRSLARARGGVPGALSGDELHGLRLDGTEFPMEITSCPLDTEEGRMVMSAVRDITERRRAEQKFRDLLESAPDAMVIVDTAGCIVLVNSQVETLFGYRRDELLGQPVEILIPEQSRQAHVASRRSYAAHPKPRAMGIGLDLFGRRRDGSEFPVEVSLSPLQTEEGRLVLSAIRDVTERNRFEQKLREASRMKSEFLANMSHELRTPLNGIIGFSEFLFDERPGPLNAKQKEYLHDILSSGRHLLQLINDILDLSKVEAGRMELYPEAFVLDELVDEACTAVSPLAQKKGIEVRRERQGPMHFVVLDRQKLKQVLLNLLSNAVKFTPEGGQVDIAFGADPEHAGERIFLRVQDSGIGIQAADLGRLFTEFHQIDSGTGKRYGGTGLGLALVRRIVELQGGTVHVESEPGKGSVFTVRMPSATGAPPS